MSFPFHRVLPPSRASDSHISWYSWRGSGHSNLYKEFKDWTIPEQIEFVGEFVYKVFHRHPMSIHSWTLDLRDMVAIFPEAEADPYPLAYIFLLTHIIKHICELVLSDKRYLEDRIVFIHDRSPHDTVLLEAFNNLKADEALIHHERLTTIFPMGWEDCVPLQPADMIAFCNYKTVERDHKKRKDFELILESHSIGGRGAFLKREAFQEIRGKLDADSQKILFKNARIQPIREARRKSRKRAPQGNKGKAR